MIKFQMESPKLLSLSEQLDRFTQNKRNSLGNVPKKTRIQNYEINLQMALLTILDGFSILWATEFYLTLAKLTLECTITFAIILLRNRLTLTFKKISLTLIKALVLTQMFLKTHDQSQYIVILILVKTQVKYNFKLDGILNIIINLIALIISATLNEQIILPLSIGSVILIEVYQNYICYKVSCGVKKKNINMFESLKMHEDIWKNRIQLIPIPIILVSKNDCTITFRNNTTSKQFKIFCESENTIDSFILCELQFQIIQDNLEQIYGSTINFLKKTPLSSRRSSYPLLKEVEVFQKNSLKTLLENFKQGMYANYMDNHQFGSIEIFCQQILDNGRQIQLSGRIMCNDEDKEFIVILNDTQKQNEFQQFIVRDEFKTKMIESFSHELKTPLNSAINFLTLVQPIVNEEIKVSCIQPALNALRLQSYLINDVIDFSQYYNHSIDLKIKEINISDLIGEITTLFEQQFSLKKIVFKIMIDSNCVEKINSDYKRLMQILVNLLQNSLKFTLQGTIIMTISSPHNYKVKFSIQDTGTGIDQNTLEQINRYCGNINSHSNFSSLKTWNGFGLIISTILLNQLAPQENKQFIIKSSSEHSGTKVSFYIQNISAPSSKTILLRSPSHYKQFNEVKGTTIIVSTQQQLGSKKIGGTSRCSLKSSEEQSEFYSNSCIKPEINLQTILRLQPQFISDLNSAFCFNEKKSFSKIIKEKEIGIEVLRAKESEIEEERRKNLLNHLKCSCRRILSVDDEIFNQTSIQFLLSRIGFDVLIAFNGDEAIKIVETLEFCSNTCNPLALILMDYQMPIMDGIQATKRLKERMKNGLFPQTHIIGLTAFTSTQHIRACIDAGMSEVLSKPLNMTEFELILESI